jgi:hypothetical protein
MALVFWLTLAVFVWMVSSVLLLISGKRRTGFRLASAMALNATCRAA